ncbi:MAG: phosphoserine phosphatase [Methylomicrobium sp.]
MKFDRICFDFDSTLSRLEGIDELAVRAGCGDAIAQLTEAAMNGEVPLEEVYGKRLELIRPDRSAIEWLAERYRNEIVDGVDALFARLHAEARQVYIVSGGIRQSILPMASYLRVPEEHVHAVDVYFDDDGSYLDFDRGSALARAGGKAEICRQLKGDGLTLAMVGDGSTDLEAKQAGACFIGFGGVVDRPKVREGADHYVGDRSLLAVLQYLN